MIIIAVFSSLPLSYVTKDLGHFDRVSAYFSDASQNFPTHKILNLLFSRVRVLYHQFSITNHSESILKTKIMNI